MENALELLSNSMWVQTPPGLWPGFTEGSSWGNLPWARPFSIGGIMAESSSSAGGGIGLLGATFIVFLVLKLCNVITWSWWWVTAPLWGGPVLLLAIVAVVLAVAIALFIVGLPLYLIAHYCFGYRIK